MNRRGFILAASATVGASIPLLARGRSGGDPAEGDEYAYSGQYGDGRLKARPGAPRLRVEPGLTPLGIGGSRDGQLLVPAKYRADTPAPLAVVLHGAGGSSRGALRWSTAAAEESGVVCVVPESRSSTWDVLIQGLGPDVEFIDRALAFAFARCNVDPKRVAICGFSDGASYALTLGLINGDFFSKIVAFSPGFIGSNEPYGNPKVWISHGTNDEILPIEQTSRRIVPALQRRGYPVTYREFAGPHQVPAEVASEGFGWVAAGK
ncbi:MAG: phospholipase [Gemmatimonadetes bacterium]|nr:phospholipase [Gemmatimonadota bacterium]